MGTNEQKRSDEGRNGQTRSYEGTSGHKRSDDGKRGTNSQAGAQVCTYIQIKEEKDTELQMVAQIFSRRLNRTTISPRT